MELFRRYKKVLAIAGFIILVAFLGYLIWVVFFSPVPGTEPENGATSTPGGLPQAGPGEPSTSTSTDGSGTLPGGGSVSGAPSPDTPSSIASGGVTQTNRLTDSPVLGPTASRSGGVQYYNSDDGRFYRIGADGKPVLLSDKVFYDVQTVTWAPDKDRAILEYPDGSKILYNFATKQQSTLPSHWEDFSFSPDSGQIVSKSYALDPENNWLVVSKDDGSQATALESIGDNGDTVYSDWSPNNQIVAMYTQGLDFNRQELYFVGLNGENFKSTVIEGRGFQPLWSSEGERLLYSVYSTDSNLNPKLWVVDAKGDNISQNRQSLSISTWASKCTFSSDTVVYCAVPQSLERGAGLFPELADQTQDDLYKINLKTGTQELVAVPDSAYNISKLMVSTADDYLYFTDKKTNQLYQIRLR